MSDMAGQTEAQECRYGLYGNSGTLRSSSFSGYLPFHFLSFHPPPFLPFLARQVGGVGLCFREWIPPCGDDAKLFEHAPIRFPFILVTASSVGFASHSLSTSLRTHRAFACTALRCSLHVPLSLYSCRADSAAPIPHQKRAPYDIWLRCTRYVA